MKNMGIYGEIVGIVYQAGRYKLVVGNKFLNTLANESVEDSYNGWEKVL